jgi:hypothetical protein
LLSFEIDSNEVMDEHFPAICTPDELARLLQQAPPETALNPGMLGTAYAMSLPPQEAVKGRSSHVLAAPLIDPKTRQPLGMVLIKSRRQGDARFSDDAELSFRNFVTIVCELISRMEMDEVIARPSAT